MSRSQLLIREVLLHLTLLSSWHVWKAITNFFPRFSGFLKQEPTRTSDFWPPNYKVQDWWGACSLPRIVHWPMLGGTFTDLPFFEMIPIRRKLSIDICSKFAVSLFVNVETLRSVNFATPYNVITTYTISPIIPPVTLLN